MVQAVTSTRLAYPLIALLLRSPAMGEYFPLILATLVGFTLLAYLLLAPVASFLDREREASKEWTPDRIAERLREREADHNGAQSDDDRPDPPADRA